MQTNATNRGCLVLGEAGRLLCSASPLCPFDSSSISSSGPPLGPLRDAMRVCPPNDSNRLAVEGGARTHEPGPRSSRSGGRKAEKHQLRQDETWTQHFFFSFPGRCWAAGDGARAGEMGKGISERCAADAYLVVSWPRRCGIREDRARRFLPFAFGVFLSFGFFFLIITFFNPLFPYPRPFPPSDAARRIGWEPRRRRRLRV